MQRAILLRRSYSEETGLLTYFVRDKAHSLRMR